MVRSQLPSPMNSSWFAAVFHLLSESVCSEGQQLHQFYLELFLLNISQRRFLNCYKVTELGCIKHIPPKLERERERERYFSFYNSSCIYSNHAIMLFGGKSLTWNQRKHIYRKKGGKALCLFYQNLLCSNYKV